MYNLLASITWKRLVLRNVFVSYDVYCFFDEKVLFCDLVGLPPLQSLQLFVERCHRLSNLWRKGR